MTELKVVGYKRLRKVFYISIIVFTEAHLISDVAYLLTLRYLKCWYNVHCFKLIFIAQQPTFSCFCGLIIQFEDHFG